MSPQLQGRCDMTGTPASQGVRSDETEIVFERIAAGALLMFVEARPLPRLSSFGGLAPLLSGATSLWAGTRSNGTTHELACIPAALRSSATDVNWRTCATLAGDGCPHRPNHPARAGPDAKRPPHTRWYGAVRWTLPRL